MKRKYVRHDAGRGTEFEKGTDGWQIYDDVAPNNNEYIVEKEYNSAFHKTGLRGYLESKLSMDDVIKVLLDN